MRLVDVEELWKMLQCIFHWRRPDSVLLRKGAIGSGPQVKAESLAGAACVPVALIP